MKEDKAAALEKSERVAEKLRSLKLNKAADKLLDGVAETLTYMDFPEEHWKKIRTNNAVDGSTVKFGAARVSLVLFRREKAP